MVEKRKSRDIPLMDYYGVLQIEFLSYYFRYRTYTREKDKVKYFDFCRKKKESIEKLALRNSFPSIFNNEKHLNKYLDKFFETYQGLPNFTYRDDYQRIHFSYWDKKYYLNEGLDIIYRDSTWKIKINLCKFDADYDFVVLEREDRPTIKVHISEIKREWDEKFDFDIFKQK